MAKIPIRGGFSILPEGEYIFLIEDVNYEEQFGKLTIHLITEDGKKHIERFSFMLNDGSANDGAFNAFAFFAKKALQNYTIDEIDHTELIGHYIGGKINHTKVESQKKPGEEVVFANLGEKWEANGFDDELPNITTPPINQDTGTIDLEALLKV